MYLSHEDHARSAVELKDFSKRTPITIRQTHDTQSDSVGFKDGLQRIFGRSLLTYFTGLLLLSRTTSTVGFPTSVWLQNTSGARNELNPPSLSASPCDESGA